jgi:hypothetical protein
LAPAALWLLAARQIKMAVILQYQEQVSPRLLHWAVVVVAGTTADIKVEPTAAQVAAVLVTQPQAPGAEKGCIPDQLI